MSDRMSDEQFDRELRGFLAWQERDVANAPSAAEMAARVSSRVAGNVATVPRYTPQLAWVLVAALAIAALLGALVLGASSKRPQPLLARSAYEAVYLRVEDADRNPVVVATGVDRDGRQREIARLRDPGMTWPVGNAKFIAQAGAVSPGGLMAIPATRDGALVQWEIFDLHHPETAPIVVAGIEQDAEQIQASPYFTAASRPGIFWGPGERLAIPWYERLDDGLRYHVGFFDGPTGEVAHADVPVDLRIRPDWAADGSGVFLGDGSVLGPKGLVGKSAQDAVPSCRTVDHAGVDISALASGAGGYACLAPDDSTIAVRGDAGREQLFGTGSSASFDVDGSFAGWIGVGAPAREAVSTPQPTWAPVTTSPEPAAGKPAPTYEAVFVRLEVIDDSRVVVVVGVNAAGQEREIARLPDAWISYDINSPDGYLAPTGVVSPGGLLAIPGNRGEAPLMMHWDVFDLRRPQAAPFAVPGILQTADELRMTPYYVVNPRGGAFWGPNERLAILWYSCSTSCTPSLNLSFFDGRTGATTLVDDPGVVLPYWAADGSGVFEGGPPGDALARIRRPDGSSVEVGDATGVPSCRSRDRTGAEIVSTDEGRVVLRSAAGSRQDLLAAGVGGYACLAPDDTTLVVQELGNATRLKARLVVPGTGDSFDIDGNFAGWLETAP